MMTRLGRASALGAVLLLVTWQSVGAQTSCTAQAGSCTTSALQVPLLNVPTLSTASMGTSSTFALIPASGLTATDFVNGSYDAASPLTVTVKTNNAITLTMYATSTTFSGSGCSLSLTDVTYATTTLGARTTAISSSSGSPTTLLTLTSATSGTAVSLYFRVALSWTADPPAPSCSLPLSFSLIP
ncbi:MAG: hypothetical protein P3C12_13715 [Gemmatimonadota bacterium]|nr:hypothetical protein [Gemmatimonadota bacterium]